MATAEILATDPAAVEAACAAGADRIELCAALGVGGVTPGPGLLGEAIRLAAGRAEIVVLVRPWAGDFCLRREGDLSTLIQDVEAARDAGASGVAVGVLTQEGILHGEAMAQLVEAAGRMPVTLHRAIDAAADYLGAAEAAVRAGVTRILTSGGAASAWEGRVRIAELVGAMGSRVEVIAGAGVRSSNAQSILEATGAGALHGSCSVGPDPCRGSDPKALDLGMGRSQRLDPREAAALVAAAHGDGAHPGRGGR